MIASGNCIRGMICVFVLIDGNCGMRWWSACPNNMSPDMPPSA
jgi:hypothetical protein